MGVNLPKQQFILLIISHFTITCFVELPSETIFQRNAEGYIELHDMLIFGYEWGVILGIIIMNNIVNTSQNTP
jgi:hypothetical protein